MTITVRALAKINLDLHVGGVRTDGYHELRTTFQSIALHDVLTFTRTRGRFEIECDDSACPAAFDNIVGKAAVVLWRLAGRRGLPTGVRVSIQKRIPLAAGLGGGSSDAAAAIRALPLIWRLTLDAAMEHQVAALLGADVPFFLQGGTALGVGRGDDVSPLRDRPPHAVVLVVPPFGVSTKEAYGWLDEERATQKGSRSQPMATQMRPRRDERTAALVPRRDERTAALVARRDERTAALVARPFQGRLVVRNDLQPVVAAHHPEIARIVQRLKASGARQAAMSGSGSAVFGLFAGVPAAEAAADAIVGNGRQVLVTRTITGPDFRRRSRPILARK